MSAPDELWRLEPHVCLTCMGRLVSRRHYGTKRVFRCTNCGVTGAAAKAICTCGSKIGTRDAGIRCVANDHPTPDCPSEIVAREIQ